jgi:hypothetical protein
MNTFTQAVWEVLNEALDDDEELLADVQKILLREYKPFLNVAQAGEVHIHQLQTYFLDKLNEWIAWLPDTTSNSLFGELAKEAVQEVYWSVVAALLQERFRTTVS